MTKADLVEKVANKINLTTFTLIHSPPFYPIRGALK
jgi:hypothetical protein